ncbi:hypothetical protein LDENG_00073230, partial [Lucifuga dentata]
AMPAPQWRKALKHSSPRQPTGERSAALVRTTKTMSVYISATLASSGSTPQG